MMPTSTLRWSLALVVTLAMAFAVRADDDSVKVRRARVAAEPRAAAKAAEAKAARAVEAKAARVAEAKAARVAEAKAAEAAAGKAAKAAKTAEAKAAKATDAKTADAKAAKTTNAKTATVTDATTAKATGAADARAAKAAENKAAREATQKAREERRQESVDKRQEFQAKRIQHGINKGYLTTDEIAKLDAQQKQIATMEEQFQGDGKLSKDETRDLRQELDTASHCIWAEKHDTDGNQMPVYRLGKNIYAKDTLTAQLADENLSRTDARALLTDFRRTAELKRTMATADLSDAERAKLQAEYDALLNKYFEVRN